jgi:hypothetical protein
MNDRARQKRPLFDPSVQSRRWEVPMEKARVSAPKRGLAKPLGGVALARSITGMIVGAVALGFLVACVGALVLDVVGPGMSGGHGFAGLDRDVTAPLAGELIETRSMSADRNAGGSAATAYRGRGKKTPWIKE